MKNTLSRLTRKLLPGRSKEAGQAAPSPEVEGLRAAFKVRYHNFKLLLAANNEAMEVMSGLEEALRGVKPFGMHMIRVGVARLLTLTYRSVRHLDELAPGRFPALQDRFKAIRELLTRELGAGKARISGPLVLPLDQTDKEQADLTGPKMANLGELVTALGLRVPQGFVITAAAFQQFMSAPAEGGAHSTLAEEIDRRIRLAVDAPESQLALASELQNLILATQLPEDLAQTILQAFDRLADGLEDPRVAIRSSSLGEDLPGASFAGQYRSKVNVARDSLLDSYKEIVASKYGLEAMSYRQRKGLGDEETVMCVGVQRMVDAKAGGVAYSHDPLGIRGDVAVVYAVLGLPKQVVDGSDQADFYSFTRDQLHVCEREIAHKRWRSVISSTEGARREPVPAEEAFTPSLTDAQAKQVAQITLDIEKHFGTPQDVEWALDGDGRLHILQARPLLLSPRREARLADLTPSNGDEPQPLGHGVTASPGVAVGEVFVATRQADILAMPKGAVLVVAQPLPRWAVILPDAAAIVAEEGSTAGHLASVAREFAKPALFSVIDATRRLVPGSTVTVDADGMSVYPGRIERLLSHATRPVPLMEGTPVHSLLLRLSRHIVPLYLLDPDSDAFAAKNCETLHDILRFCHEKSVEAMFRFGHDNPFPERSGKQLVYGVPMQFWIIDLEDGFKEPVPGKRVDISNIQSRPMLAIWRGMIAVPWDGPPAPRARGLASIFHEATINTGLDVSMPTPYINQNYFMISRDFVSQQSRFGFHFSTVEALVGERQRENYINFQFKGGAASQDRRIARAQLVGQLLEHMGFNIRLVVDSVAARLENQPAAILEQLLAAIGYLSIHTRQLDIVMESSAAVETWKKRLLADIDRFISGELGASATDAYAPSDKPA